MIIEKITLYSYILTLALCYILHTSKQYISTKTSYYSSTEIVLEHSPILEVSL